MPAAALHPVAGFEGSYVAVAGEPGRGAVHVVESVPALGRDAVTVVNGVSVRTLGGPHHTALVPVAPPPVAHPSTVVHTPPVTAVQSVQPAVVQPAVVQPAVVQPAVVQPAVVQPAVVQPAVVQPSVVQPSVVQPAVVQAVSPLQPAARECKH